MHSSVVGHLSCGFGNSAAINTGVQVALPYPGTHSFGYILRSGI
jgi:hypothetical protein